MAQDPQALIRQAEKALAGGGGFSFFRPKTEGFENAVELYTQAANAYRMQKMTKEAGMAFEKAASIQRDKLSEPDDAANTLAEAFKAYRKTDPEDAVRVLSKAIQQYCAKGNFRRAATHQQSLAEVLEVEIGDQKRALDAYETAAGWFENDNAEALANKLFLKVGDLAALEGDYYRAVDNYEKVAKSSVNNNLMRWSIKDYLLKAGICHLATTDMVGTMQALDRYRELDNGFQTTREHQLLNDLADAIEKSDQEAFSDKLFQFDQMSKLDKWKTTILLRVKNNIQDEADDFA